ncbi:MBG domain-containing protein [Pararcticibacter amylolyticus]|uniref:BIG2 domain-containing protein n=1 Tax=Pararcticibacter amylolyticus TaxID=2173175 RepID=A0A2U2PD29_9SPHI|nr:MBG domain-containing protein [Pararcticibacter amylolyticus]PWG79273.1 hypothetical protein DDR33_18500 [Pararcticibacter amylolyticus]
MDGTLTVGKAMLTITADNKSRIYGAANPALTVSYSGFVNGDTPASITAPSVSTTATTASAAGTYPIVAIGAASANYAFTYVNGVLTVGKAMLTITADNKSRIYGAANPALTVSYSGFVNGDTPSSITAPSVSTTATTASAAGTYSIVATGAASANYTFTYVNGVLTVGKATLTITANNKSKIYGAANPALTVSYSGFVNGDTPSSITAPSVSTTATTTSPSGAYPIVASGAASANYDITYVDGVLTVGKAMLTITANNKSKIYGAANPALTVSYSGFVNGDTPSSITAPSVSTTATTASAAGTYPIVASGAASANYDITYVDGTLTVGKAMLTITADDKSKIYGAANPALTVSYSGFVNGDTEASITMPSVSTTATTASAAGTYPIVAIGAASPNYNFTYVNGILTVGKAMLTITANDKSKIYGAVNPALTVSYSGFVNGDTPSSITTPVVTTTATTASAAGTYPIVASGAASANYDITYVDGALTVGKATLTITADNKSKIYGTANPTLSVSYSGLVNGDTPSSITPPVVNTTATAASAAGVYPIVASGAASANYDITYVDGTLTVGKAALTITAEDKSKVYGAVNPALTVRYSGFVNGDTVASITEPSISTTATTASAAGTYPIVAIGAASANYNITYVNGTLTVGKAALTITAEDKSKVYGAANPVLTVRYSGFVNGDTEASITEPSISTTATAVSATGTYPITAIGAASANYNITYVNGTLTIGKAALTITAEDKSKIYGAANPVLTVHYSGFVNGDTETSIIQPSISTTATAASAVGTYPIVAGGAVSANYDITYVDGTLTVGKAALTITAEDKGKIYGAANPVLTVSYSGFVNGDTKASITEPSISTTATTASAVGTYPVVASGAASANYNITYVDGTLTVGKAMLTITADNKAKIFGAENPVLTVSYSGFVNGDTEASITQPAISTTATTASPAGAYPIVANAAASANYEITYVNGTLSVGKAMLTITADNKSKIYGSTNPALTVTYSGFVNGDTEASITAPSVSTAATAASAVGTYPIVASGAASANYNITYVPGTLTVGKAMLTITADNKSKIYGAANPALTVTYSGFVNGDTQASITIPSVSTPATAASAAGTYAIVASGAASANYEFTYAEGTLTVGKAALSATADNKSKIYGTDNPVLTVTYSGFVNGDDASALAVQATAQTAATKQSSVGTYPVSASGAVSDNYNISYHSGTLTVTKALLTAKADNKARNYNEENPALTVTYIGFVNGDTESVLDVQASAATTAVKSSPAGDYVITAAGGTDNNYALAYESGILSIGKSAAVLTVADLPTGKKYGDADFVLVASGNHTQTPLVYTSSNPGVATISSDGTVHITGAGSTTVIVSQEANGNYAAATEVAGALVISKSVLTVTASDVSRKYLENNPVLGVQYSGFVNGEDESALTSPAGASTPATVSTPVGAYDITPSGAVSPNYEFVYKKGTLTIIKTDAVIDFAELPVKTYGDQDFSVVTGSPNPESPLTYVSSNTGVATIDGNGKIHITGAGSTDITVSQAAGTNYESAPSRTRTLTVNKKSLQITAENKSKKYLEPNPEFTAAYSGFVNGEDAADLSSQVSFTTTADNTSPAGTYPIVASGAASANYEIAYENGTLVVNQTGSLITFNELAMRTFGDAAFSAGAQSVHLETPLVYTSSNTNVASVDQNGLISITGAGQALITVSQASSANYEAAKPVSQQLTVLKSPAAISVTSAGTRTYGDADFALNAGSGNPESGISYNSSDPAVATVNSQGIVQIAGAGNAVITVTQAASANFEAAVPVTMNIKVAKKAAEISFEALPVKTFGDADFAPAAVGTHAESTVVYSSSNPAVATIVNGNIHINGAGTSVITASLAESNNYLAAANVTRMLTVNKAPALISFSSLPAKKYGDVDFAAGAGSNHAESGITYRSSDPSVVTISGGNIHITGAGTAVVTASMPESANYAAAEDVPQTITVSKAPLVAKADNKARNYNENNPALTVSYIGFVNGETETVLDTKADASTNAVVSSPAGEYTISVNGATDNNYEFAYQAGILTIGKSEAVLSLAGIPGKQYGDSDFAVTAASNHSETPLQYSSSNPAVATVSAQGVVHITGAGSATITVSQAGNINYAVAADVSRTFTVQKAPLKVSVADASRKYGRENPEFSISYNGFVNGENEGYLKGRVGVRTPATASSPAGQYAIQLFGGASDNYEIGYENGTLTIGQAENSISFAELPGKTYGDADFSVIAGSDNTEAPLQYTSANPGVATIDANGRIHIVGAGSSVITVSQPASENYAAGISQSHTLTVAKKDLHITAENKSKKYGEPNPEFTAVYTGFVNGDDAGDLTSAATMYTTALINSETGIYPILIGGAASGNYAVSYDNGTLIVNPAESFITFGELSAKTYGDMDFAAGAGSLHSETPLQYTSSNAGVATVDGNGKIHITGAGEAIISVSQAAGSNYEASQPVLQALRVLKSTSSVVIPSIGTKTYGDADFALNVNTNNTESALQYNSSNSGVFTVSEEGTVHITGAGNAVLTVTQPSGNNFNAATAVSVNLMVRKKAAAIGFGVLASKTFGDADFAADATSNHSETAITYTSGDNRIATIVDGKIHIVSAGTVTITASQAESANYLATAVSRSLVITKAVPVITVAAVGTKTYGDADFALSAGSTDQTTRISYISSNPAVAIVTGDMVRVVGSGITTIKASQAGSQNFEAADTTFDLVVNKAVLTVTAEDKKRKVGQPNPEFTIAYSGFVNNENESVLTSRANAATDAIISSPIGEYDILVSGGGALNYNLVYQTGTLSVVTGARTLEFGVLPVKTYGDADFEPGAVTDPWNVVIYSSSDTTVAKIVDGKIRITGAGKSVITATIPESMYGDLTVRTQELTVQKAPQTITFAPLPDLQRKGQEYQVLATASSGLPVSMTSSNPWVATVKGMKVKPEGMGSAMITVSQEGDKNYLPAKAVVQELHVVDSTLTSDPVKVSQLVTPDGDGINDALIIEGITNYPENHFVVFTRTGTKVYEVSNYDNGDVSFSGKEAFTGQFRTRSKLPQGTYYYVLRYKSNGEWKRKTGFFVLKYNQ